MSGLDEEQLGELECCVAELLEEPWDKGEGRPRELTLREALVVTCGYLRQNIVEDVWADIFDVDQSTISRYITFLTPLVEKATDEDRPTAEDAAEATRDAIALVDGTLWPCWSWDGERKLWSGKYRTTGHGSLIVTNLQGRITFVSEPVTGNQHDMAKLKGSDVEKILKKAGGVFGDKGFIGTDYITTPIRKPQCRQLLQWEHEWNTQVSSFRAPVGSPNLTGVPPGQLPPLEQPGPAGRYGALASSPTLATVRDGRRVFPRRAWRAARVVAMRTRRVWFLGLANPRAFLATSFAVRLWASAFAFE